MLQEYHPDKVFWPNNNRVAVTLTFFQGGEDVRPARFWSSCRASRSATG